MSDPEQRDHSSTTVSERAAGVFGTTHWSVVLGARDEDSARSLEALETLCRAYWRPLYTYARGLGKSPADAEDLTQGFFAVLLEKDFLRSAARDKGKFRTFLKVAFKRFLANAWDREHALKRGGRSLVLSIDLNLAESQLAPELAHAARPDILFDRQWAMTLLERTMGRLREEYLITGRAKLFEHLQACIVRNECELSYAEIAGRLGLTEAAVKMAVQRLRARYRDILLAEIWETVASPAEAEEELKQLFSAFQ